MGFEAGAYAAEEILGAGAAEAAAYGGAEAAAAGGAGAAIGGGAAAAEAISAGAETGGAAATIADTPAAVGGYGGGAEGTLTATAADSPAMVGAYGGGGDVTAATATPNYLPEAGQGPAAQGTAAAPTEIAPAVEAPTDVASTSTDAAATDGGTQMRDVKPAVEGNANVISTPQVPPTVPPTSSVWQTIGATPFQVGALGLGVYGQYKAAEERKSVQEQLNRQAQLTRPAAESLMSQYQSGTIGPAQEKQISDYTSQQKAQIKQRYAKMGRDPNYDSAAQQEMANVDVQAASMRDTALQNVLKSGLAAAGVTAGPYQQAVMAGYQADTASQTAQANFLYQLAQMQAKQGSGAPTTPAAPAEA